MTLASRPAVCYRPRCRRVALLRRRPNGRTGCAQRAAPPLIPTRNRTAPGGPDCGLPPSGGTGGGDDRIPVAQGRHFPCGMTPPEFGRAKRARLGPRCPVHKRRRKSVGRELRGIPRPCGAVCDRGEKGGAAQPSRRAAKGCRYKLSLSYCWRGRGDSNPQPPDDSLVAGPCARGTYGDSAAPEAALSAENPPRHTFVLTVPAHLADAVTEAVSAIVEAATDPSRRMRDFDIAAEAWRRVRVRRTPRPR